VGGVNNENTREYFRYGHGWVTGFFGIDFVKENEMLVSVSKIRVLRPGGYPGKFGYTEMPPIVKVT